jgi:hypothetical protein
LVDKFIFISDERKKKLDFNLNRKSNRAIQMLALALAFELSICAASASVTYTINSGGLESFNVAIDGTSINGALAGGILINKVSGDSSMPASYVTVCTDIEGTLYLGQSYEYNTPTTPFSGQTGVNPTWGAINTPAYLATHSNTAVAANAAQAIQNAAHLFYTYGQLTSTGLGGNTDQMAALQLAIWEALYDTTANGSVTGTRFTWSGGDATVLSDVNSWLSGLTGDYKLTGYLLSPAQGGGVNADGEPPQELLIAVPVPESPTVIAGALLLLPFAASAFKIIRKTRRV